MDKDNYCLTHLFLMYPFSNPWKHQGVEKWCIGNEWINLDKITLAFLFWKQSSETQLNYQNNNLKQNVNVVINYKNLARSHSPFSFTNTYTQNTRQWIARIQKLVYKNDRKMKIYIRIFSHLSWNCYLNIVTQKRMLIMRHFY